MSNLAFVFVVQVASPQPGWGRCSARLQHQVTKPWGVVQTSKNGRAAVVAAGSNHNLLITRRGEIFAWGLSSSGELGQRDTPIDQAWPVQVAFRRKSLLSYNSRLHG